MFAWIDYIQNFYNDLLTSLNSYITADITLITYTIGTQIISLFNALEMVLTILTVLYVVKVTYKFIKKFFNFARRKFT